MSITMIEVLLATLAIVLGLGAFAGFWLLKGAAQDAAREEARKFLEREGAKLTEEMRNATEGEALVSAVISEDIKEQKGGE